VAHPAARERTARQWITRGKLTAARFGIRIGYRIRRADFDDFYRRRTLSTAITRELTGAGGVSSSTAQRWNGIGHPG
jgi:excisionase family DNA binding protein